MHKILYVHHCAGLGGGTNSLLYLLENVDRRKYAPEVLFLCEEGDGVRAARELSLPVHLLPGATVYEHASGAWFRLRSVRPWELVTRALQVLPSAAKVARFLRDHPVDLIHLNSLVLIPAALAARRVGVPVVWHDREELHRGYLGVRRAVIRRLLRTIPRKVIAISQTNAGSLGSGADVVVVYNFVNFAKFDRSLDSASCREGLGGPAGAPVVSMLGGAVHNKGALTFIRAAARVRKRFPEARFLIFGYPPKEGSPIAWKRAARTLLEAALRIPNVDREASALIKQLGLARHLRFVGMRRDVERGIAASDVIVFPATESHFGRPIIEAGAMAKPVVASRFPSTSELVLDGNTGYLAREGDPADFAERIARLLGDPSLAGRMGEAGYRLARERYDGSRNAEAIFRIYDAILEQG